MNITFKTIMLPRYKSIEYSAKRRGVPEAKRSAVESLLRKYLLPASDGTNLWRKRMSAPPMSRIRAMVHIAWVAVNQPASNEKTNR